ncbi:Piwi-domain-containing protein [Dacryopinax primogenitus]|uniref:Piwi-domain-containing protein n=1 Tax=Dacryopinax primogenitus (strain DJM 731) TaxID=1858805 RepID=M5FQK2_DACPD|nr:Piwi-domain-containing protein [Dacryopinax primogenitus]EJT97024.1 Piwi-domain-containing protein [Dacryopinax primogenitus]
MPPQRGGDRGSARGSGNPPYTRGGGLPRGSGPPPRGGGRGASPAGGAQGGAQAGRGPVGGAAHVTTIAVRRPGYGTAGKQLPVIVNAFPLTCPPMTIFHYDVVINKGDEQKLPLRLNLELIDRMQSKTYREIFARCAASYDGRKNLYTAQPIPLPEDRKFLVPRDDEPPAPGGPPPKMYTIILTEVAQISPQTLERFAAGLMSHDENVTTALTAMNVALRMLPNLRYPFNIRSFYTDKEFKNVGAGLEVWRGYFQSARWGVGRLFVNVDISTGQMYQRGPLLNILIDMMQDTVGQNRRITPETLCQTNNDRDRMLAHKQIGGTAGVKVVNRLWRGPGKPQPKLILKVLPETARTARFTLREGGEMTVEQYIKQTYNYNLRFPHMWLVQVGKNSKLPIEICDVIPGQLWKRQTPPNQIREILAFATQKPPDRLRSIQNSMNILEYGQSQYLEAFNMKVTEQPIKLNARILDAPRLMYGNNATIAPRDGAWNMKGKKFIRPSTVNDNWWFWNLDQRARIDNIVEGLIEGAKETGVGQWDNNPLVKLENVHNRPQGMAIVQKLDQLFTACVKENQGNKPMILVVLLPYAMNNELYQTIKYLGDIRWSVPTQCMQANKAIKGNAQYFANIMLKVNVKLGGVNVIPDRRNVPFLMDPANPSLVLGADCIHPSPGSEMRPTFAAVVSSVDTNVSKYYAQMRPQESRVEIIADLADYTKIAIDCFRAYRTNVEKVGNPPARLIYFRDGVSEGQFQQVLDHEVTALKEGCRRHNIAPKITAIIVGKRHHIRMFPERVQDSDRSGNCPAGTIIDDEVVHPTEFDFFLQSHGGLLGTSKPTHYTVLLDESNMKADELQHLCYSLCHVYQRSTRSVSIPAPTYYADIVCSRFKNHFEPGMLTDLEHTSGQGSIFSGSTGAKPKGVTGELLGTWKQHFSMPRDSQGRAMYFM